MTKLLADSDLAIGFFNLTNADLSLSLLMEDIGFGPIDRPVTVFEKDLVDLAVR